jgi:hypothetical protein
LKDPESLHRAALEKALSKNIASGRKIVDLDSIRPVTPSFMQIPGMLLVWFVLKEENAFLT